MASSSRKTLMNRIESINRKIEEYTLERAELQAQLKEKDTEILLKEIKKNGIPVNEILDFITERTQTAEAE